jgi:peroxiredoxin
LLSISPDPTSAWREEASKLDLNVPLLSDSGNRVASMYGVMQWKMGNEPGHTFVLVDRAGIVRWIGDYGAPEHGGLMYVPPNQVLQEVDQRLP